jgi:hypothetical protein
LKPPNPAALSDESAATVEVESEKGEGRFRVQGSGFRVQGSGFRAQV